MASSDRAPLDDAPESQPPQSFVPADGVSPFLSSSEPSHRPPSGEERTVHASHTPPKFQLTSNPESGHDESASLSYEGEQDVIIGRYKLLERIGRGAFGVVYRAEDQLLKRHVALKLLTRFQNAHEVTAWLEEARVLASLDHPAIVPVYDVGKSDRGQPFIVSKLIEGGALNQRASNDDWTLSDSMRVLIQLAHALDYLHGRGTMHRDIKPSNILLTKEGNAILVDFGLALPESGFGRGARFVGTPAYMSPEQARYEGHRVDGRSDIYSLGVVFYELLTGKRPFQATDREELLDCIRNVEVRPPRQINHAIPRELERICMKALSKKISDRYPTAADMAEDLEQWSLADLSVGSVASSRLAPLPVPDTLTTDRSIDLENVAVVPHGLRSFEAGDSDFFRLLVAGARDRNGIPESISFWTNRILSRVEENTFRVGVLFGPSGSGKSSLIRAGVIPLVDSQVTVVYVDAKPEMLEATLARQILKAAGVRAGESSLPEMLNNIRAAGGLRSQKKLLIVIDQFEQWLNYQRQVAQPVLQDALRQCDGVNVQAILIVRDDFVLGVSSFMDELDEPLQQHRNFVTVEPFGHVHAKKVLTAFGRAYGAISHPPTPAQTAFVEEAVRGFQAIGRVEPLQVALLAEMTKSKPWTPATLKQMGGIEGLGVTFLEERLTGASAHPFLRANEVGVRRILAELLPKDDTQIKPPAILESDLIERLKDFTSEETVRKLIHALDTEVRLVTPTSNLSGDSQNNSGGSSATEPAIQLAHDYLVATTRKWLAIHQTGTREGRVREQLREIATAWKAKPSRKRLPTFTEWVAIHWFTAKSQWTMSEAQMMRAANQRWLRTATITCLMIIGCSTLAGFALHRWKGQNLSEGLASSDTSEIPRLIREVEQFRRSPFHLFAGLVKPVSASDAVAKARADLHFSLANASISPEDAKYALDHIHEVEDRDLKGILETLFRVKTIDNKVLAEKTHDALNAKQPNSLPLLSLLAHRDPEQESWQSLALQSIPILLREPISRLPQWTSYLLPVKQHFTSPLLDVAAKHGSDTNGLPEPLISLLATLCSEDPAAIAKVATYAPPEQMIPVLRNASSKSVLAAELRSRLKELTAPNEMSLALPPDLKAKLASWGGVIYPNGGWSETIPEKELLAAVQAMQQAGFAPSSIRCSSEESPLTFSATWVPDVCEVEVLLPLSEDLFYQNFDSHQETHWALVDFDRLPIEDAAGKGDPQPRWIAVWHRGPKKSYSGQQLQLSVSTIEQKSSDWHDALTGMEIDRYMTSVDKDGDLIVDALLSETASDESGPAISVSTLQAYSGDKYPAYVIRDLREQRTTKDNDLGDHWKDIQYYESQYTQLLIKETTNRNGLIENGNAVPSDSQNELITTVQKLLARLSECGKSEDSLLRLVEFEREMHKVDASIPSEVFFIHRATCLARLGRSVDLEKMMAEISSVGSIDESDRTLLRIRLALHQNSFEDALIHLQTLETFATESKKSTAKLLENQLRGLALVSVAARNANPKDYQSFKTRLITKSRSFLNREDVDKLVVLDCDFEGMRNDADWIDLLDVSQLSQRVTMIFAVNPKLQTRLLPSHNVVDFSAADHRAQAARLVNEGFSPHALEYSKSIGGKTRISSVWIRESVTPEHASRRARVVASLSLSLAYLNEINELIPGLEDRYGRSVQTALVASLAKFLTPRKLIEIYQSSVSTKLQAILISSLGESPWGEIDPESQVYLKQTLPNVVRSCEDPHLAAVAKWACNIWDFPLDGPIPIALTSNLSKRTLTTVGQEMIRIDGSRFVLEKLDLVQQQRVNRDIPLDTSRLPLRVWSKLDRNFKISSTEITGDQFQQFVDDPEVSNWLEEVYGNVLPIRLSEGSMPQSKVSWHLAIRYCQWLSQKEGIPEDQWCYENVWSKNLTDCRPRLNYLRLSGFRLPTLAEWTLACSGGTSDDWHFGSDQSHTAMYEWTLPHSNEEAHPVARLRPNGFGLFDMGGNLSEWIDTKFKQPRRLSRRYYIIDGANPADLQFDSDFIICGGRYNYSSNSAVSSSMIRDPADFQTKATGFRVAQTIITD